MKYFLKREQLQELIDTLIKKNYQVIGPQARDGAIVYEPLIHAKDLPWGMEDEQDAGQYRLTQTNKKTAFNVVNGPQGLKPFLFKAKETLWKSEQDKTGKVNFTEVKSKERPKAIIGARACDLEAMRIQDKVFIQDRYVDPHYHRRREQIFIIAVNCTRSSNNCFCVSAGGYPKAKQNFDLSLTELEAGFILEVGSDRGKTILSQLELLEAEEKNIKTAEDAIAKAAAQQTKTLPYNNTKQLRDALFNNLDHPQWEKVAERCLSCGNCTSVCPTCFCHTELDLAKLDGTETKHQRQWDSCFTAGHSEVVGHVIRDDTQKRYRQWLTHKLGSWHDQFDESGCVGCGRCVTWCPVGIDITEEAAKLCDAHAKTQMREDKEDE